MLVRDVSASARFYCDTLGFRLVMRDAATVPTWALLRRGEADLLVQARDAWPEEAVPLSDGPLTLYLALDGAAAGLWTDPDGVRVVVTNPAAMRRAA